MSKVYADVLGDDIRLTVGADQSYFPIKDLNLVIKALTLLKRNLGEAEKLRLGQATKTTLELSPAMMKVLLKVANGTISLYADRRSTQALKRRGLILYALNGYVLSPLGRAYIEKIGVQK